MQGGPTPAPAKHWCDQCRRNIHAICGHPNGLEDFAFQQRCTECSVKTGLIASPGAAEDSVPCACGADCIVGAPVVIAEGVSCVLCNGFMHSSCGVRDYSLSFCTMCREVDSAIPPPAVEERDEEKKEEQEEEGFEEEPLQPRKILATNRREIERMRRLQTTTTAVLKNKRRKPTATKSTTRKETIGLISRRRKPPPAAVEECDDGSSTAGSTSTEEEEEEEGTILNKKIAPPAAKTADDAYSSSCSDHEEQEGDDDDSLDDGKPLFTAEEQKTFEKGWAFYHKMDEDEAVPAKQMFPTPRRNAKLPKGKKYIGSLVAVPAVFWGEDSLDGYWREGDYHPSMKDISNEDFRDKVVLIGKVTSAGTKDGTYTVAFFCVTGKTTFTDQMTRLEVIQHLIPDRVLDSFHPSHRLSRKKRQSSEKQPSSSTPATATTQGGGNDSDNLIEEGDADDAEEEFSDEEEAVATPPVQQTTNDPVNENGPWTKTDPKTKADRVWTFQPDGVVETSYHHPNYSSVFRLVPTGDWPTINAYDLFMKQLPTDLLKDWTEWTSARLHDAGRARLRPKEMEHFLGCLIAQHRSSKIGGVGKSFEVESDGLFPATNLGRFGMSHNRFKEIYRFWTFASPTKCGNVDTTDPYWDTDQLDDRFNDHYAMYFNHARDVNIDERMFWMFIRGQPGGPKVCDRKPRGTGQEKKCLSATDVHVTTQFEHVRNKTTNEARQFTKEYGAGPAAVLRLCLKARIDGSGRRVICDSWFANLALARGLRKHGLHLLGMVKTGSGGYPKAELQAKVLGDDVPRGAWAAATTYLDQEGEGNQRLLGVVWRGKGSRLSSKKKKNNWVSTFLCTDCTTTLPGVPAEKKRHDAEGKRAPSKFVDRPRCVQEYYDGMPASDIVNRHAQFLLGLESAVRTQDPKKRMVLTTIGTWVANAWGMAKKWTPKYKDCSLADFAKEIILGGLFPPLHEVQQTPTSSSSSGRQSETRPMPIDARVHPVKSFKDLKGWKHRQQRCVICQAKSRKNPQFKVRKTTFYCSLCVANATTEAFRNPSRHAYCVGEPYQCFSQHIANCYTMQLQCGETRPIQRQDLAALPRSQLSLARTPERPAGVSAPRTLRKRKRTSTDSASSSAKRSRK